MDGLPDESSCPLSIQRQESVGVRGFDQVERCTWNQKEGSVLKDGSLVVTEYVERLTLI